MAGVDVEPAPHASGISNADAAFDTKGGKLMGWMAPASTGVAMRHNAGFKICL
jgi:hypothetical protein